MSDLISLVREVKGPQPLISKQREAELTERQREILDELGAVFDEGFHDLTMADLASRMGCSLRTLYGLAASRDELVLLVVDRNLWRTGRTAMMGIEPGSCSIEAIRSYLKAANVAVSNTTPEFSHDCASLASTREMHRAHTNYLMDVTRVLLDRAVALGEIDTCDTAAIARVVAGLGSHFASPSTLPMINTSPKEAADAMVDIILAGLPTTRSN